MGTELERPGGEGKPQWDFVGPDEHGTVIIEWQGAHEDKTHGFPLGHVDDVCEKVTNWLAQRDFGE